MRKCSIELLWNIMLNVARDNNSKHSERMEGLSRCTVNPFHDPSMTP